MAATIFYSWQSDTPTKTNRHFIESALKAAVEQLGSDMELQPALRDEALTVDRDTQGVAGTPRITDTIFAKIAKCTVFVPDLTFVGKSVASHRLLPNPNVLIEYGWAVRDSEYNRMLPVMNSAYGSPRGNLPFDMQHIRYPVTYNLKEDATQKEIDTARADLAAELAEAIKLIIKDHGVRTAAAPKPNLFLEKKRTFSNSVFWDINKPFGVLDAGDRIVHLDEGETLFLRLIPTAPVVQIDTTAHARMLIQLTGRLFSMATSHRDASLGRNEHGVFVCEHIAHLFEERQRIITNLTQLFMSRELWGIDAYLINSKRLKERHQVDFGFFPCAALETVFVNTLANYMHFASRTLQLPPPLKFIAGATHVEGYRMSMPASMGMSGEFQGHAIQNNITYEGLINTYSEKPTALLRPFFAKVWDVCGLSRPDVERIRG